MTKVAKIEPREKELKVPEQRPLRRQPPFLAPFEEMERMLDEIRSQLGLGPWPWAFERRHWPEFAAPLAQSFPRVELRERDDALVLRADIPGVAKEDLEVSMTDDTVTIAGHTHHHEEEKEAGELRYHETYRGEFTRTIRLPVAVDGERVTASHDKGVLELVMPKVEKARRRTIEVQ